MIFDTVAMVDWSGGNDTGATPRKDAIWACVAGASPVYLRNRGEAEAWLSDLIASEQAAGRRLCIGFDFPFGYPAGFAEAVTGRADPFALWAWLAARIEDSPTANNRFDLAGQINARFAGIGPFWGNALPRDIPDLPRHKRDGYDNPFPERRAAELEARGAFALWQLAGAGAVGSQVLMGLPVLERLRRRFAEQVAVWPFEPLNRPVAFVEIWPSLISDAVAKQMQDEEIKDAAQVRVLAEAVAALPPEALTGMLNVSAPEEGWILGLGHEDALVAAATGVPSLQAPLAPPPLRNDCFALPPGVDWVPVETALARLEQRVTPVVRSDAVPVGDAAGRILAAPVRAKRAHPPAANSAVDGYGFAGPAPEGDREMPLVPGRAAAGQPLSAAVPAGHAVRILTGAILPEGVDTVVLQEDVAAEPSRIAFRGPLKAGANARKAAEDIEAGEDLFEAGHRLSAPDLAVMASTGVAEVQAYRPLRVGVLSTGDEVVAPGDLSAEQMPPGAIYDANRPMLLAQVAAWGCVPVDLGRSADDRDVLRSVFDHAVGRVDAILTSGGASTGDEDHVSALLQSEGQMETWRIAVKPGRPLALGLWRGVPVFGLPGNPVAAFVCTLVFARPALRRLGGGTWRRPDGMLLPAAFAKRKKPGRTEYLRARLGPAGVEVFASEGSGRVSGLSWATGLVELDEGPRVIAPGDPVRFLPYAAFD